jgi:hypothetical protein
MAETVSFSLPGIKEEPMKIRDLSVLASLLMMCVLANPAVAGSVPYVRVDYGGNQLRMTDHNNLLRNAEALLRAEGYSAELGTIGSSYGPGASVGLWILPGVRVGATYSYLRVVRNNRFEVPGEITYVDNRDFRKSEAGVEAVVRLRQLAGLTVGVNVAQAWGEMTGTYSRADAGGLDSRDVIAHRTKPSFGGFVGLDQTNAAGVAGFFRVGFQYCDMGWMSARLTSFDGTNTVQTTGNSVWTDFSGFYLRAGVGYDLLR